MTGTLITSETEFDADDMQSGYLRVPHSDHRMDYGWSPVPTTAVGNGDEFEGRVGSTYLAGKLAPGDIRGRLILLALMNCRAAETGTLGLPFFHGHRSRLCPSSACQDALRFPGIVEDTL